tara:strand:- start:114734 stop:115555 length:822 start_codon:yes stop_codon:yes gene_type:complete
MKTVTITSLLAALTLVFSAFNWVSPSVKSKPGNSKNTVQYSNADSIQSIWTPKPFDNNETPKKIPLEYTVRPVQGHSVTEESLQNATSISEVIPNYPSKWIEHYTSVEIASTLNNQTVKVSGPDEKLTSAQKELFNSATVSTNLDITVHFTTENNITKKMDPQQMNVLLSVVPAVNASYYGGYKIMIEYLKSETQSVVSNLEITRGKPLEILFFVAPTGDLDQVSLENSSGNTEVDAALIEVISQMPKWKPALTANGTPVKQQYLFILGLEGC